MCKYLPWVCRICRTYVLLRLCGKFAALQTVTVIHGAKKIGSSFDRDCRIGLSRSLHFQKRKRRIERKERMITTIIIKENIR